MSTELLDRPLDGTRANVVSEGIRILSAVRRPGGALRAAKSVIASRMKTVPTIFLPIARLRENHKRTLVRRTSDIAIEGYWRCGNHFATYAFIQSQPRPVHVAHHFHAPAQLMLAARWGVPAVLLVREPVAAVASATAYLEHDDPGPLLDFYNIFHSSLLAYRGRLVVSDFSRTIGDFASVVAEVNERFGRDFALYRGTDEEETKVRERIRNEHRQNMDGNPATLPLPSKDKEVRKKPIVERIRSAACRARLQQARELYEALLAV